MEFEWDPRKRESNLEKHGIDFERAKEIFAGPVLRRRSDCGGERRWLAVGETEDRIITVIYTLRGESIRIISARAARKDERRKYRQKVTG